MSRRTQRRFAPIAFVVLASACAAQQGKNQDVRVAPNQQEQQTMSYYCADFACGTPRSPSSGMLDSAESRQNQSHRPTHNDCPTSTCEPMTRSSGMYR